MQAHEPSALCQSRRWCRRAVWLSAFLLGVAVVPRWWCGREADRWFAGDATLQAQLAGGVAEWVQRPTSRASFATGSPQFDGEWLFGTYLMAGLGFGQTALEHPEMRASSLSRMNDCIQKILLPEVRAFDRESWKNDPIESLDGDADHAAYLGYFNLLLSFHRWLDPAFPHANLNDRITAALVRRIERSPTMLLETYPREVYPVDNAAVIASIGLYDRATGADHAELRRCWAARCRAAWMDPRTGLLFQGMDPDSDRPWDAPRGSGTCLGLYFLSFADAGLAAELQASVRRELQSSVLGFGLMREYPRSARGGTGDIDSGPVLLGYGVSATGFGVGGSRLFGDASYYTRLLRTVHLFGAPLERGDRRQFVSGGPIGDAIMFAMLTATSRAMPDGPEPR
jgi:hypothetical protein